MREELYRAIVGGDQSITISLTAGDLREVVTEMVRNERTRIAREVEMSRERHTLTRRDVARQLNTSLSTLARWAKSGYLVPKKYGTKVLYRQSDIDNINNAKIG